MSNTPFRLFKKNTHEGGIASPFIAWFPRRIKGGTLSRDVGHLIDILPTCLAVAGVTYPHEFNGKILTPTEGISLTNLFVNQPSKGHDAIFWEHEGSRAVRKGSWKLVAEHGQPWALYNLETDRTETQNLADQYPERVAELASAHQIWSQKVGVVDWDRIK